MANTPDPRARRFREYVERLTVALGHADRHEPMRAYLTGLCLPGERKSIEPMAARVDPRHVRARHQSMHHFVANAPWDGAAVLRVARDWVLEPMARHGPVAAWIVDDTAYPKKGRHSVGVARQYCGPLGKQDNCQVAVSVSLANDAVSLPVAYRLYLPESWAQDRRRRRVAGVPDAVEFQPKWQLALAQIRTLQAEGVPPAPGRGGCRLRRHDRVSGGPDRGRPGLRGRGQRGDDGVASRPGPAAAEAAAGRAWPSVDPGATDGAASAGEPQAPGGGTARLRVADRDVARGHARGHALPLCPAPRPTRASRREAIRAPPGRVAADRMASGRIRAHEVLALDPAGADPLAELVRLAKLRWRIERDYQELKDELGLDHFEGRGWRGFHHHGALCIAAYAFLAAERATLSPPEPLAFLHPARLPKGFTPRGAPGAA